MKKLLLTLALLAGPTWAMAEKLSFQAGETLFTAPLLVVNATEVYSFREGKGYPGLETVLVRRGNFIGTFGAAAVLGESQNVPFVSVQTRLSPKFFDTSNNELLFGVWVGKEPKKRGLTAGLLATVPLW